MMHTLPETLPGTWLVSSKQPSSDGCYESFIVVRDDPDNKYHPFRVHLAYYQDDVGTWAYSQGDYCATREEAMGRFKKRAGLG